MRDLASGRMIRHYFKGMDRASSEPELNTEPRKRTVGDTSFDDAESSSNKQEILMSPPFVSLVTNSSLWKETPSWALILHNDLI